MVSPKLMNDIFDVYEMWAIHGERLFSLTGLSEKFTKVFLQNLPEECEFLTPPLLKMLISETNTVSTSYLSTCQSDVWL